MLCSNCILSVYWYQIRHVQANFGTNNFQFFFKFCSMLTGWLVYYCFNVVWTNLFIRNQMFVRSVLCKETWNLIVMLTFQTGKASNLTRMVSHIMWIRFCPRVSQKIAIICYRMNCAKRFDMYLVHINYKLWQKINI